MKIIYIWVFLLMVTSQVIAQETALQKAKLVYQALKDEKYDELNKMTDISARKALTKDVFSQIREVISGRDKSENTYNRYIAPVNSKDSELMLAFLKTAVKEPKDGPFGIGEFKVKTVEGINLIKADIPNSALDLVLRFDKSNNLVEFYLDTKKVDPATSAYREPGYADPSKYEEKQVFVRTGSFILPGTLTFPKGVKNFPIVIFVHGTGPSVRDASFYSNKPFRDCALGLATMGIASVRYDKRTMIYPKASAMPGKDITIQTETTDDVASAIKLALSIPSVDKKQIYVAGHSLGGMMTPQILKENPVLKGGIMLGGPARPVPVSLKEQVSLGVGMNETVVKEKLDQIDMINDVDTIKDQSKVILNQTVAFWKSLQNYNQLEVIKEIKQPVLILQGERDYQVPFGDLQLWKNAVKNKTNVTIKSYSKLNHAFLEGEGPAANAKEYYVFRNVPQYVITDIVTWIFTKK